MNIKKIIIYLFLAVPVFSATISAFHLERFLALGNPIYLSVTLAIVYEIANLCTMAVFVALKKIKKEFVWTTFILLILMQIVGNVYFSFNFVYEKLITDETWVTNFIKLFKIILPDITNDTSVFILSMFIGVPVPLIAILLTKSVSDYLGHGKIMDDEEIEKSIESEIEKKPLLDTKEEKETENKEKETELKEDISLESESISSDSVQPIVKEKDISNTKENGDNNRIGLVVG